MSTVLQHVMDTKEVAITAGFCLMLGFLIETYLMKRFEELNSQKRSVNYANVMIVFVISFGILFALIKYNENSSHVALNHIKVGEPPF